MELGISSYTYNWEVGVPGYPPPRPMTAVALIEKAAAVGVSIVQIADNLPLHQLSEQELGDVERCARDHGIAIEVGTRGIAPDLLLGYLRLAERFGSPILRTVTDSPGFWPSDDETIAMIRKVVPDFESSGVTIALENHDRFKAVTLLGILERIGSPLVGICFDTANSFGCGEGPETVLEVLATRVVNLHVKDYAAIRLPHSKGFLIEGRPAGQGQLDIPALLARLSRAGSAPNAILELWTPPEADVTASIAKENAWAAESIRYLRTLIPSKSARAITKEPASKR